MATGNLALRPHSIVTRVLYDKDRKRARGVEVLDAATRQTYEFKSKPKASDIFTDAFLPPMADRKL